ncbi:RuBisCO large subunit C-terminal-like domain-containing protein [Rhodohalobacter halophilus]|uniref:RuBisCO large subunit C-terminal-like domain-containing protein n=1 Tax=Rhodohalobacter halophilus TaxID=1812810 RepID=UPI00083F7C22|nr:RuBisCO large subunit C-terminal-like domain-containing protein [Rhodohalobacter halophilus]
MSTKNSFWAQYHVKASGRADAESKAEMIAIEQSVEMPPEVVPDSAKGNIAYVTELEQVNADIWSATITFKTALFDSDITQFLNILFGNISLQPWCSLVDVDTDVISQTFQGPSFGIEGVRELLGISNRALSCAVIKPIGTSSRELATMAEQFTCGGIDIIKDDHGLTNQRSAPFKERVQFCLRAVRAGEQISGKKSLYFPNITTSPLKIADNYKLASDLGADGVLIAPQLIGPETVHELASLGGLPIMVHPAFSGSVLKTQGGISPILYFGKLMRALGSDISIYPNAGGRFSFSRDLCKSINSTCRSKLGNLQSTFPAPGGGVRLDTIAELVRDYGVDTLFLIGGSLYKQGDLRDAAQEFQKALDSHE